MTLVYSTSDPAAINMAVLSRVKHTLYHGQNGRGGAR